MQKPILSSLLIIALLSALPCFQASANSGPHFNASALFSGFDYGDSLTLSHTNTPISTKRDEKYDESKDPALRKGTENWEQPQGSFWAIPAAVVGLILIIMFLTRNNKP
jgi:hypothetical protein